MRGWFESALDEGWKRWSGLGKEGKFVDHHGLRPVGSDAHQPGDGLVPPGEPEWHWLVQIRRERISELV